MVCIFVDEPSTTFVVPVDGAAGGVLAVVVGRGDEAQRGERHQRRRRLVLLDEEAAVGGGQHAPAHGELEARRGLRSFIRESEWMRM